VFTRNNAHRAPEIAVRRCSYSDRIKKEVATGTVHSEPLGRWKDPSEGNAGPWREFANPRPSDP